MATATVNYRAEIADLRAKLASIPDVTRAEARKMVTELNRSMRAVEKANKAAAASVSSANRQIQTGARANAAAMAQTTAAANRMANASRSVAMQLPDVASQLAAGTPAMTVFTQQGLQVVQMNMQLVESGAKRMGLSLGSIGPIALAVAPAVVALGAVYVVLSRQLEEAEARAASFARGAKALGDSHTKLTRETAAVELELAKLTGTLDEVTAAQERRDRTIRQAAEAERRAAAVVVEQAEQRLKQADGIEEVRAAEAGLARARQQHSRIIAGANTRERTALEQSAQIVEYTRERAASEETLRQREEARAKATAEAAKRDAELLRLMREREAASNQLGAITARSTLVVLEGEARLREEYRRQMSQIAELEATSRDHINADVARAAVREELEKRLTDLRERNAAKAAAGNGAASKRPSGPDSRRCRSLCSSPGKWPGWCRTVHRPPIKHRWITSPSSKTTSRPRASTLRRDSGSSLTNGYKTNGGPREMRLTQARRQPQLRPQFKRRSQSQRRWHRLRLRSTSFWPAPQPRPVSRNRPPSCVHSPRFTKGARSIWPRMRCRRWSGSANLCSIRPAGK